MKEILNAIKGKITCHLIKVQNPVLRNFDVTTNELLLLFTLREVYLERLYLCADKLALLGIGGHLWLDHIITELTCHKLIHC